MARSKRKPILGGFDFQKIDPYGGAVSSEQPAATLHLEAIRPDPNQPRNLLPKALYEQLSSGQKRPGAVLQLWLEQAAGAGAAPAWTQAVAGLRRLAATIAHKGLINPITVREPLDEDGALPAGVEYVIVTGERRWWAHVLLTVEGLAIGDGEPPDQIRATVVPAQGVRALQLIENIAREDLSVLEKAQGLLALRGELEAEADENVTWAAIEEMLGMSRSYRSRILKVLRLSAEAQALVAEYGLTEKVVRPVAENLLDRPDLQLQALRQAALWQQSEEASGSHRQVARYVEQLLQKEQPGEPRPAEAKTGSWLKTFHRRVTGTLKLLDSVEPDAWADIAQSRGNEEQEVLADLQLLRERLELILAETE